MTTLTNELGCRHIIGYSEGSHEAWLVFQDNPLWCIRSEVFKFCPRCGIEMPNAAAGEIEAGEPIATKAGRLGWVSVKDRLPPEGVDVLIFCPPASEHSIGRIDVRRLDLSGATPCWRNGGMSIGWSSHWMPLPEMPPLR